jgi:hypothetical protein
MSLKSFFDCIILYYFYNDLAIFSTIICMIFMSSKLTLELPKHLKNVQKTGGHFRNLLKLHNYNFYFLTIFSATIPLVFISRFFSAPKKHFFEEPKNGHFKNVQK